MCHQKQILDSFCATMHDESLLLITVENSHLTTCQNAKGAAKPILLFIEKFVPDFHKSKDLLDRILLGYDRVITTEGLWVHPHGVTKEMEQLVHQNFLLSREFEDHLCDFCKQYVDGGSVKDVLLDHFEDILGKVCMMTHVVARLFASLYSQGFGVSAEDHVEDTGRDVSQDANGTGMGEGAGVNDVSDQINDEDQLLGAFEKPNEEKVASNDVPGENDVGKFPHEKEGILKFYGECWKIFNALNSLELKSLEEPIYLFGQFFKKPTECLTLAYYLPQNAGDIARKFIKDPQVLSFIDAECFIVSTVNALQTPMINASMVLCDRHYGGINYPVGGVGGIAKSLAKGLVDQGSEILYKANVKSIIVDNGKAVGVRLSNGREFFAKNIISNATRWDTFGKLLKQEELPTEEERFQKLYVKAPSFLSIHLGVKADVLPPDTDCHHFILENDWSNLEEPYGSIFLSIPTVLDPSLAPEGNHILHIFTTSSIEDWLGISQKDYESKKELMADQIISRLEKKLFPGLRSSVVFKEVGTPKTHRRYLARDSGTYGPMPRGTPKGLLGMPFNTTAIDSLYCVGDSCFPGQGVIAVAFSGVMCAHRVAADLGLEKKSPILDAALLRLLGWFRSLA